MKNFQNSFLIENEINVNFWYKILIEILIGLTQLDENFKFVQFHGIF